MKTMKRYLFAPICFLLAACGQDDRESATLAETGIAEDDALWENSSANSKEFDPVIQAAVRPHVEQLEKANDKEYFCPGYAHATDRQRESCWVSLVKAVATYESGLNPRLTFQEPDGNTSVGLLMLSPGECNNADTVAALKNAHSNLNCGVGKMAHLVAKDGYISGPTANRGAARYWSVLRDSYTYGKYKLGKKKPIARITHQYLSAAL